MYLFFPPLRHLFCALLRKTFNTKTYKTTNYSSIIPLSFLFNTWLLVRLCILSVMRSWKHCSSAVWKVPSLPQRHQDLAHSVSPHVLLLQPPPDTQTKLPRDAYSSSHAAQESPLPSSPIKGLLALTPHQVELGTGPCASIAPCPSSCCSINQPTQCVNVTWWLWSRTAWVLSEPLNFRLFTLKWDSTINTSKFVLRIN